MFKSLCLVASSLAIIALVLVMCVSCANAGDLIYTRDFGYEGLAGSSYETWNGPSNANKEINAIFARDVESIEDFDLSVTFQADKFSKHDGLDSYYIESDVTYDGNVIGHCQHGYSMSGEGDVVYYQIIWDEGDPDLSAVGSGFVAFKFSTIMSDVIFEYIGGQSAIGAFADNLGSGCFYFGWYKADETQGKVLQIQSSQFDIQPKHFLNVWRLIDNTVCVYDNESYYDIHVLRNDSTHSGKSKWHIYAGDVWIFVDESSFSDDNLYLPVSFLAFDDFCTEVSFNAVDQYTHELHENVSNICSIGMYVFDLEGYTKSVFDNLIDGVNVSACDESTNSDGNGYYSFSGLSASGGFWLTGNKTGFHDSDAYVPIFSNGSYYMNIYMIPLDALDPSEFGGIVYDICTLKPIQGAYVYLFNETADSGSYAYSNKYGFYRFAGMAEGLEYEVSASKDGHDASIVHSFTFNESNINETHCKTKNLWLLPEGGCPEDGGIPTPPPAPTPTPHEWTNEEIVSQLRITIPSLFFIVLFVTFIWFLRKAGGAKR